MTRAIIAALKRRRMVVQSYKLGPDYIDSGYHAASTGRACVNLDSFLLAPLGEESAGGESLKSEFLDASRGADVLVVESVGGVFDDWYHDGTSPAQIAQALGIPILLVVDGFAACQTLGLTINAILDYHPTVAFAGVVATKVSSQAHYDRIIETVREDHRTQLRGFLPGSPDLYVSERHLGLVTSAETDSASLTLSERIATLLEGNVDLDAILESAASFPRASRAVPARPQSATCCIAIARDKAFSFYYDYNLRRLEDLGAKLLFFSPLTDNAIPDEADAAYLGGGFPEVFAPELAGNHAMLRSIRARVEAGLPVYAECGGLVYLASEIEDPATHQFHRGVGVFPFQAKFADTLSLSYVVVELTSDNTFGSKGHEYKGHVFHRTDVSGDEAPYRCAQVRERICGGTVSHGYRYKNVYASYVHAHFRSAGELAAHIVEAATSARRTHT